MRCLALSLCLTLAALNNSPVSLQSALRHTLYCGHTMHHNLGCSDAAGRRLQLRVRRALRADDRNKFLEWQLQMQQQGRAACEEPPGAAAAELHQ